MNRLLATAVALAAAVSSPDAWAGTQDCGLEPPTSPPWVPVPARPNELPPSPDERPRVVRMAPPGIGPKHFGSPNAKLRAGALTGKTVYLSPGHGFYSGSASAWQTQRGNTFDVVEDLVSTEVVTQFLAPMLVNAGAHVVTVRESDLNTHLDVVDDADADFEEQGPAATFQDSSVVGFGHPADPLLNAVNPFTLGGNRLMEATVGPTPTAQASWTFDVPEDGNYNVYISYTQFSYRVPDAHFAVRHAGGEAHFRVNQRRHGSTWVLLGRFYFRAGKDPQQGAVVAFNDSSVVGNVSLDAVRLGGGMGLINRGIGKSGRPRFEEAARYHAQYMGAPTTVYDNNSLADREDDVSTRSRFAAWDHEPADDGVYVAWHTNACGTSSCTARGTETYVYGPNPPDGSYNFTGVAGSDLLAQAVHGEIIHDLRGQWQSNWNDRGIRSAYFGELNPNHNPETPSVLLEMAFHNTQADAAALKEPRYRYVAARAIAQGIIKYYATRDGVAAVLPPEPPVRTWARNMGEGMVRVGWAAAGTDAYGGGPAASFIVYGSEDGHAWDDGLAVNGTSLDLPLPDGQTRYFRIAAVNAGGESFPSEVVGVRRPEEEAETTMLVVNGFDRFDAALAGTENLSLYTSADGKPLGSPNRLFVERMNDGTYLRRHGAALDALEVAFDSATAGAMAAGEVPLAPYALVDFMAGRGASGTVQVLPGVRDLLHPYVEGGGRLLLSGPHVASGLGGGAAADQQFLADILRAQVGAGSGTSTVEGVGGEALDGINPLALDNGLFGAYPAGAGDVLVPQGSVAIAQWGTSGNAAAVRGSGTHRVAYLAFPFETVNGEAQRADLMARLLTSLEVPMGQAPPDAGVWDAGVPDAGEPDAGMPDAGTPDAGTPDAGVADAGPPEPTVLPAVVGTYQLADGCGCTSGAGGFGGFALLLGALVLRRRSRGRRQRSGRGTTGMCSRKGATFWAVR